MVTPTPTAGPFTAAITGLIDRKMRNATNPPSSRCTSLVLQQLRMVEGRTAGPQVGAGAEAAAAPGHDHRTDVVVGVGTIERVDQLLVHAVREHVEPIGSVERDREDAFVDLVTDLGVVHRDIMLGRIRRP